MNKLKISFLIIIFMIVTGTFMYYTFEDWTFVDSAYFSVTTLSTVGYGDLHPTNNVTKVFTIFYVLASVTVGLYALSSLANHQQPKIEKAIKKTIKKVPVKKISLFKKIIPRRQIS